MSQERDGDRLNRIEATLDRIEKHLADMSLRRILHILEDVARAQDHNEDLIRTLSDHIAQTTRNVDRLVVTIGETNNALAARIAETNSALAAKIDALVEVVTKHEERLNK